MNEVVSQALGGVGKVLENFVLQSGECLLEVSFNKVSWRIERSEGAVRQSVCPSCLCARSFALLDAIRCLCGAPFRRLFNNARS